MTDGISLDGITSVVQAISQHARLAPAKAAIITLADGEAETGRLTFGELDAAARSLSGYLTSAGLAGQRVMILLPQSAEYVVALMGCLYAGAVAVPAYPPSRGRRASQLARIMKDCTPALALTTRATAAAHREQWPASCAVVAIEEIPAATLAAQAPEADQLAYLQYTSGSTSTPRGVMVSQHNVVHQCRLLSAAIPLGPGDVTVSWLPMYHDMGLVLGMLYPLLAGSAVVLMAPDAFARRPLRWLAAVSRYRATVTYSPNFALELCSKKITAGEREALDLSCLRTVAIGAEPVQARTLEEFAEGFGPSGFRIDAFQPGYGMAETTLAVTLRRPGEPLVLLAADAVELGSGYLASAGTGSPRVTRLVGNGGPALDTELIIVAPDTGQPCPDGREGEIWVRGLTITAGYWGQAERTAQVFGARLADGRGPFMRTGDLGIRREGQLFITGRRKDLIIINGSNHYPHDIERTVGAAHPALNASKGAAFSVFAAGAERLVIVHELDRARYGQADLAEVARSVQLAVGADHDLVVHAIVLLKPASLPMTLNGKIKRAEARRLYLEGLLAAEHAWHGQPDGQALPPGTSGGPGNGGAGNGGPGNGSLAGWLSGIGPSARFAAITRWLTSHIAGILGLPAEQVSAEAPFGSLGLDSAALLGLAGDLERWLGQPVSATGLYNYPTIARFARFLADGLPEGTAAVTAPPGAADLAREPIAVVGMACQFPCAPSTEAFWDLIMRQGDAIGEWPKSRPAVPGDSPRGGFVDGIDEFDAGFFRVSPAEARSMDPQQRLLLTTVWRALEDAGVAPAALAGTPVGVFVGISSRDYWQLQARDSRLDAYSGTGSALSVAANRVSHVLDLRGPSLAIDTACSSSLVAVHQATTSLRLGECDLAIVGGVNLLLDPDLTSVFRQAGMLAPDGRCKTFDAAADGYARGEGCGVVILQRQSDATGAGNRVLALVRGSAVSQDGLSSSLTTPSGLAQEAAIRGALAAAGMQPGQVGYVEAHGTGTRLGDPIEVAALREVYGAQADAGPLWVGSVKPNIGHLEAAAGIAGLIKLVLALRHQVVPGQVHLRQLSPRIAIEGSRIRVPAGPQEWPAGPRPRTGAVSSFGFGGTNAHVVVSESPAEAVVAQDTAGDGGWHLLPVSARDSASLRRLADDYVSFLDGPGGGQSYARICDTAGARRSHHRCRLAVLAPSAGDASVTLTSYRDRGRHADAIAGIAGPERGPVGFMFTGQGSQYLRMAARLYRRYALIRQVLGDCDDVAADLLGLSLLPALCGTAGAVADLDQTVYAQPAVFMTDYALAALWQACGVRPDYLLGHSLGEYVAACVAGVLSLPDAIALVVRRGQLMQERAGPGAMYSVHAREPLLAELCQDVRAEPDEIAVAAFNGPENLVVSGEVNLAGQWAARWAERGARITRLAGTRAFHSPLISAAAEEFGRLAGQVTHRAAAIPIVSNVTGEILARDALTPGYWTRHSVAPVQFATGLRTLGGLGCTTFVEAGPQPVLTTLGAAVLPDADWLVSMRRGDADDRCFQRGLGRWYASGGTVDWAGLRQARAGAERVPPAPAVLPGYPLARTRYWYQHGQPPAPSPQPSDPADLPATDTAPDTAMLRCYDWAWEPASGQGSSLAATPGTWLVAGADAVTVRRWRSQLKTDGHEALGIIMTPLPAGPPEAGIQSVDPESAAGLAEFFAGLRSAGVQVSGLVLHGGPFAATAEDDDVPGLVHQLARRAFLLLRHFLAAYADGRPRLVLCSSGASAPGTSPETPAVAQGVLTALARAVAAEYSDLACVQADLDPLAPDPPLPAVLGQAVTLAGSGHLAVRGGRWYLARLRESELPAPSAPPPVRPDATYLITGGLGGLGLAAASRLASLGARCLLLIGRTVPVGSPAEVASLRDQGVRVVIRQADVSDPDDLAGVLRYAREELPELRGVLHAAGVIDDASLENLDWPRFAEVLAPKVDGAWQLHRQAQGLDLDFFVLFSSLAALTGSAGQASYLVANTFLDLLARYRRQLGQPALSIGWGPWCQTGLAARPEVLARFAARGVGGIATGRALDALAGLLSSESPYAGAARLDWPRLRAGRGFDTLLEGTGQAAAGAATGPLAAGRLAAMAISDPAAASEVICAGLLDGVAAVLGLSEAGRDELRPTLRYLQLQELGLDSLMAAQLRRQILADFAADVPPQYLFGEATVAQTVEIILQQLVARSVIAAGDDATAASGETEILTI